MAKAAKNDVVEETTTTAEETATEQAQAPESISLADLQVLHQIVDVASQRGAFRGGELTQVGRVYDKLSAFLAHVEAVRAEEEGAEGETAAAGDDEVIEA